MTGLSEGKDSRVAPRCLAPATRIANMEEEVVGRERECGCAHAECDLPVMHAREV